MFVTDYKPCGCATLVQSPVFVYRETAEQFQRHCASRGWTADVREATQDEIDAEINAYKQASGL